MLDTKRVTHPAYSPTAVSSIISFYWVFDVEFLSINPHFILLGVWYGIPQYQLSFHSTGCLMWNSSVSTLISFYWVFDVEFLSLIPHFILLGVWYGIPQYQLSFHSAGCLMWNSSVSTLISFCWVFDVEFLSLVPHFILLGVWCGIPRPAEENYFISCWSCLPADALQGRTSNVESSESYIQLKCHCFFELLLCFFITCNMWGVELASNLFGHVNRAISLITIMPSAPGL